MPLQYEAIVHVCHLGQTHWLSETVNAKRTIWLRLAPSVDPFKALNHKEPCHCIQAMRSRTAKNAELRCTGKVKQARAWGCCTYLQHKVEQYFSSGSDWFANSLSKNEGHDSVRKYKSLACCSVTFQFPALLRRTFKLPTAFGSKTRSELVIQVQDETARERSGCNSSAARVSSSLPFL